MSGVLLATAGYDHTIRFWQATSAIPLKAIQFPDSQVNKLVISPKKKLILAAGNPNIRFFDLNPMAGNSNPLVSCEGHTNNVVGAGFEKHESWVYSGSEDGTLKIWDLRTKGFQKEYNNSVPINDAYLHPNQGEIVFGTHDGRVKVWDLSTGKIRTEMVAEKEKGKPDPVRSVHVSYDGKVLAAATNGGNLFIWGPNIEPITLKAHDAYILRCLFSPDASYIATTSADFTIKLWERKSTNNWKYKRTLALHQEWVWDCAFSADSIYLLSASSDHTARLWDIGKGESIRQYSGHHKAVTTVALNDSPD